MPFNVEYMLRNDATVYRERYYLTNNTACNTLFVQPSDLSIAHIFLDRHLLARVFTSLSMNMDD